jgi:hypothetical protein
MTIDLDLSLKDIDPESVVETAMKDSAFLEQLLEGIGPGTQKGAVRSNCSQAVMLLSQKHPEVLAPHWEFLNGLLKCDNSASKYVALHVMAENVAANPEGRFDGILDQLFTLLGDESVVVAGHMALVAARIAQARPDLAQRVIRSLLAFDQIQPGPAHRDLVAGYIIETLRVLFPGATESDKDLITAFVWKRQDCASAKTRKLAKEILKEFI